jgi:rubrerythrin
MRQPHELLLETVIHERNRILSRRGLFTGAAKLGLGAAAAVALANAPRFSIAALAADADFTSDVDVLNYALTLEHLEYAFYRDGVGKYALGMDAFGNDIGAYLGMIGDHEKAHVDTLTKVIGDLKGTPVAEATYDFGYTDAKSFLATAAALENTGVMAYDGAGHYLQNPDLLTAAGGIVAVEARHASYLNLITGAVPFPASFETAATKAQILKIAGPFIKS